MPYKDPPRMDSFNIKSHEVHLETAGLAFVEFTSGHPEKIKKILESFCFQLGGHHRSKSIALYRHQTNTFLVNSEPHSHASHYHHHHGAGISALGFFVKDVQKALMHVLRHGATIHTEPLGPMELNIPAIKTPADHLIYLIENPYPVSWDSIDFKQEVSYQLEPSSFGEPSSCGPIQALYYFVDQPQHHNLVHFYTHVLGFHPLTPQKLISPCRSFFLYIETADALSEVSHVMETKWGQGIGAIEFTYDQGTVDPHLWPLKITKNLEYPLSSMATRHAHDHAPSAQECYLTTPQVGPVFFMINPGGESSIKAA